MRKRSVTPFRHSGHSGLVDIIVPAHPSQQHRCPHGTKACDLGFSSSSQTTHGSSELSVELFVADFVGSFSCIVCACS